MRYHYKPGVFRSGLKGETYICQNSIYRSCTLYREGEKGLGIIQQRYDPKSHSTWWTSIDSWLVDELYMNASFKDLFARYAAKPTDRRYPVLTIRQAMWRLKLKPLPKQEWETVFDRAPI